MTVPRETNHLADSFIRWIILAGYFKGGTNMSETVLVLIKPDAVRRKLIGKILDQYEQHEIAVKNIKMMQASRELLNCIMKS